MTSWPLAENTVVVSGRFFSLPKNVQNKDNLQDSLVYREFAIIEHNIL